MLAHVPPPACPQDAISDADAELRAQVSLYACSHLGDARLAPSLIVVGRPLPSGGGVAVDWYGYVAPSDVPDLLDALRRGDVLARLWRGGATAAHAGDGAVVVEGGGAGGGSV